jgi:E-phenylitaconyl-CoA hydratase
MQDAGVEVPTLQDVRFEVDGGVAMVVLDRPHEGNAFSPAMAASLRAIWAEVKRNPDIRVAIVTGAGERHFCTGAAVQNISVGQKGSNLRNVPMRDAASMTARQNDVTKPVICVVNGLANGGGLHFVVDSDIVIASEHATFMDTHVNIGLVGALENIGLARRMTLGSALLLTLAGKAYRMPAARAYQLGLVDLLEPTIEAAMARAQELARAMCRNSPQAMALSKQAIWESMEMGYDQALQNGWNLIKLQWAHPDFVEGPKAFAERREPVWNPDPDARNG